MKYSSMQWEVEWDSSIQPLKLPQTGYIQRRLIKGLEDLISLYDGTVRNNKSKIIQFSYGNDNIDPIKIEKQYLPICVA